MIVKTYKFCVCVFIKFIITSSTIISSPVKEKNDDLLYKQYRQFCLILKKIWNAS